MLCCLNYWHPLSINCRGAIFEVLTVVQLATLVLWAVTQRNISEIRNPQIRTKLYVTFWDTISCSVVYALFYSAYFICLLLPTFSPILRHCLLLALYNYKISLLRVIHYFCFTHSPNPMFTIRTIFPTCFTLLSLKWKQHVP